MDFCDRNTRALVARALGIELRQAREERGWTRAEFATQLPSGLGEGSIVAYEHGLRQLTVLRLMELCVALKVEPSTFLGLACQRAMILLEKVVLHVDLHALLADRRTKFRRIHEWARNKLNRTADGVAELTPAVVGELATCIGHSHEELASYLAQFVPDAVPRVGQHPLDG